jgi:hypothetical protein
MKSAQSMWKSINLAKRILLTAMFLVLPIAALAQWSSSGGVTHTTDTVGIGTTSPASALYVAGGSFGTSGNANQSMYALGAQSIGVDYSLYSYVAICAQNQLGNCGGTGGVVLGIANTDATVNIPASGDTLFNGGDVGIGTTSPSSKLHVVGDVTVTGNIAAKYQDIAEWVPSREKLKAGSVVVLDKAQSNSVIRSSRPYDTTVAGVVSPQPGLILGEQGAGKFKVATTGRVKVHVDAGAGAIEIGDVLVTSAKPGTAM